MNLLNRLKVALGGKAKSPEELLAECAADPSRTDEFLKRLAHAQVFVAIKGSDLPDPWTEEAALRLIEKDSERLASVTTLADIESEIFTFAVNDRRVMPIFSSQETMGDFTSVAWSEKLVAAPANFMGVRSGFDYLLNYQFDAFLFCLDPGKPSYRLFGAKEREHMRQLLMTEEGQSSKPG